jgi:hypothetical protein
VGTYDIIGVLEPDADGGYAVLVKNPFVEQEVLEWIGPGLETGEVAVAAIRNHDGISLAHPGTTVTVAFSTTTGFPEGTILRRKRRDS